MSKPVNRSPNRSPDAPVTRSQDVAVRSTREHAKVVEAHPVHPALVHFPLTFFLSAQLLDVTYGLATHPSTSQTLANIYDVKPYLTAISHYGNLATILGLLSAIPSVTSGIYELLKLLNRQRYTEKIKRSDNAGQLNKETHPKVKIALAHAATMDLVIAAMAYNWWTRSANSMSAPSGTNVIISALMLPLFVFGAHLGGTLVYGHGVGVDMGRLYANKQEKIL
ncbi:hypothetical protein BT63DRAFT_450407 [Microthyrium microscopicum]|uniref:DUF2231 domain-containing protein n=1 Tax=Microthyrium microscopicum TaxID=703497 RepID=A0A6A6UTG8_9PEZI|nr:hypothetical protein BT63DRAFT_450407 [Microthyrium microscopicum]